VTFFCYRYFNCHWIRIQKGELNRCGSKTLTVNSFDVAGGDKSTNKGTHVYCSIGDGEYYSCPGLRSLKKRRVQLEDLDNNQAVLVNYNFEEASERGFWYDAVVSGIKITSSAKSLACTISVGE
jgi:hypothetical protein